MFSSILNLALISLTMQILDVTSFTPALDSSFTRSQNLIAVWNSPKNIADDYFTTKTTEESRRSLLMKSSLLVPLFAKPQMASAYNSCLTECIKECRVLAPKDTGNYCTDTCKAYCDEEEAKKNSSK